MTKVQKQFNREKIILLTNGAEGIRYPLETKKKINVDLNLTYYVKINSKIFHGLKLYKNKFVFKK